MPTETQVKMASTLYGMRDRARGLLGDRYKARMAEFGGILSQTAARDGKSVLEVAVAACKRPGVGPMEIMLILSAAVELTEPTP